MGGVPDLLFVIDTNKEDISLQEAKKLGIPVAAILDSNSNPDNIDYPIPGNDDATRAIKLYCRLVSDAVLYGMQESLVSSGIDLGEATDLSDILQLNANRENDSKKKDFKKKVAKVSNDTKFAEEKPAEEVKSVKKTRAKKTAAEEE